MTRISSRLAGRTIAVAAGAGALRAVRNLSLRWGATHDELSEILPGDDVLHPAHLISTRAIAIASGAADVWPWIAQLGQGRGGFYSYDALENLVGCHIHSAEAIVDEWQRVVAGDDVRLHPDVALTVNSVEPGRALVLRGAVPMGNVAPPYDMTWAFVLREQPDGSTRLLVRERYHYRASYAALIVEPVELVSFLMSHRMLLGIKRRAERNLVR